MSLPAMTVVAPAEDGCNSHQGWMLLMAMTVIAPAEDGCHSHRGWMSLLVMARVVTPGQRRWWLLPVMAMVVAPGDGNGGLANCDCQSHLYKNSVQCSQRKIVEKSWIRAKTFSSSVFSNIYFLMHSIFLN